MNKGLSKNTRYTKYKTIGLIRIHDDVILGGYCSLLGGSRAVLVLNY